MPAIVTSTSQAQFASADSNSQAMLKRFLARRHPEYMRLLSHWEFCHRTYEGGREWFAGNIFRYFKEGDDEYKKRIERAYRFNHTREVVDLVDKYIFKQKPARNWDDASDVVKGFWRNCTLSGLDADQYARLMSKGASIFGRIWVFVDSNATSDAISIADQKLANSQVYSYIVDPRDVLDIGFDDVGALNWILVRERVRDDRDPILSTGLVTEQYRLWEKGQWSLYRIKSLDESQTAGVASQFGQLVQTDSQGQLVLPGTMPYLLASEINDNVSIEKVEEGENKIGVVPCFPVDNVIGQHRYHAPALINDIAYLDRAVGNYLSNLDAIVQDQTFSQLAMPAQGMLPGDDKYESVRELGTKRIFLFDAEGGEPKYLSPDVKQANIIVVVINKIINEIYHSIGMGGERTKQDNAVGIDNSSGVAKAYDFERLNSLLVTKSKALEDAERQLTRLVEAYHGKKFDASAPSQELIKYADTFDVRSLYDDFTVAERLALIDAPKTVRQEQMKAMVDKLFPALGKALKDKMLAEIEKAWPLTLEDQMQVTGSINGEPNAKFPASGKVTTGGGAHAAPPVAGKKPDPAADPKSKNPQTQKRQGQVTSETK